MSIDPDGLLGMRRPGQKKLLAEAVLKPRNARAYRLEARKSTLACLSYSVRALV